MFIKRGEKIGVGKAQAGSGGAVRRGKKRKRDRQGKSKRGRERRVLWRSFKLLAWGKSFQASSSQSSYFIWP